MNDTAYKQGLARNVKIYYLQKLLLGLEFFMPIWVAFELKFTNFAGLALLETIQAGISIIMELPTGAFADIFGRKQSVALGMFASGIVCLFYPFSISFSCLVVAFALWGLSSTFISGAETALLYDSLKDINKEDDFAKISSKGNLIFRLAIALATLAGGFLYLVWNPIPYLLYGVMYLVSGLFALMFTEPKIDSEKFSIKSYFSQTKKGVIEAFKNTHISLLSVYYIVIGGITWSATFYFSNVYAQQNGFGPEKQGILFSFVYILKATFAMFISYREKHFSRRSIYWGICIFIILSFAPAYFLKGWAIVAIILATEFASSLRFSLLDKYVNQEFDSNKRATALSFLNLSVNLIYIVVVLSTGTITNSLGVGFVYSVFGLVSLIVIAPITFFLVKNHHS